jgi:outer membrane protein assembly factor BamB
VVDRTARRRRDRIADGPMASFPIGDGVAAFVGAPSYDPVRGRIFVSQAVVEGQGSGYGIAAFAAGPGCSLHRVWLSAIGSGNVPPPPVVGDVILSARGAVGGSGALSTDDGRQLWSFPTKAQTISPLIEAAGKVFGGDLDGDVYAFRVPESSRLRPR